MDSTKFNAIKQLVDETTDDVQKFIDGNNAAGGRVRKHMQTIKKLAQEVRKEVQEVKNSRKPPKE